MPRLLSENQPIPGVEYQDQIDGRLLRGFSLFVLTVQRVLANLHPQVLRSTIESRTRSAETVAEYRTPSGHRIILEDLPEVSSDTTEGTQERLALLTAQSQGLPIKDFHQLPVEDRFSVLLALLDEQGIQLATLEPALCVYISICFGTECTIMLSGEFRRSRGDFLPHAQE